VIIPDPNHPPPELVALRKFQAAIVRRDPAFHRDVDALIRAIEALLPTTDSFEFADPFLQMRDAIARAERKNPSKGRDKYRIVMQMNFKFDDGRDGWAYFAVIPSKLSRYEEQMASNNLNIFDDGAEEFGELVCGGYGKHPPLEISKDVMALYTNVRWTSSKDDLEMSFQEKDKSIIEHAVDGFKEGLKMWKFW